MISNELVSLKKRILDISYKYKLGHLGSCLSTVSIIKEIYDKKNDEDLFVLSSGHSGLALYCVLEQKYNDISAEDLFNECGVHPHRIPDKNIHCSTGSLGLGITVAVGFALANRDRDVYVVISDGESSEGSVWESLKFIEENNLDNIHVYVNMNGYSAISKVNTNYLENILKSFYSKIKIRYTDVEQFYFLKGVEAHYHAMSEQNYKDAINELKEGLV